MTVRQRGGQTIPYATATDGLKRCGACTEILPVSEFHHRQNSRDGFQNYCKACRRADNRAPQPDLDGPKTCSNCGATFPRTREFFYSQKGNKDGLNGQCKPCVNARVARYQASRPDKTAYIRRFNHLKNRHNITPEQYDDMVAAQNGLCAACGYPPPLGERLFVDHDHACCPGEGGCGRCIRGLLCSHCNKTLGLMKDDPLRLIGAARYLIRWTQGVRN